MTALPMPLKKILSLDAGRRLALWQMTENPAELPLPQGVSFADVHSEVRLREKHVSYAMLRALTGNDNLIIRHLPSGKPVIDGYSLSISHTKGWAAMLISEKDEAVGVDIEYFSDRVNKVASRFIRPDEQSDSLAHRLVNWSAKEAVYKMFSDEDLQYFDMRLKPFVPTCSGYVTVEDLKVSKEAKVSFVLTGDYVLTWSIG